MSDDLKWYGDQWLKVVQKAEARACDVVAAKIVNEAQKTVPVFLGQLRRSISFTRAKREGKHTVAWVGFAGGSKDAFKYAMAVEKGRKPGKPPPSEALELWVERVLHVGQVQGKARQVVDKQTSEVYSKASYRKDTSKAARRVTKSGLTARERAIKSVAYLVARAIGRKGTEPQPFLLPAYDKYALTLQDELEKAMLELQSELPQGSKK